MMAAMILATATIPQAYRGDWALSAAQCAPGPADAGNLRVGRRTIWSFESRIDVRRVRNVAPNSIEVASRVHHGDAEFGDLSRMTLLNNGARLAVGDGEDRQFYVRCER
jgi:hypothetical protein